MPDEIFLYFLTVTGFQSGSAARIFAARIRKIQRIEKPIYHHGKQSGVHIHIVMRTEPSSELVDMMDRSKKRYKFEESQVTGYLPRF